MAQPLVVIPTYNEAGNVQKLLDHILSLPSKWDVLIVDDNSPDGTADLVKEKMASLSIPRIHLLQRPGKLGLGTAYCTGFDWALDHAYTRICEMDADFSHDPNDLERLLRACENADLVLGSRYMHGGGTVGWSKIREGISRSANLYARMLIGAKLHDLTGGFKCYRRETLMAMSLSTIRSEGYAFQIETTTRVLRAGFRVAEIPITFREREHGKSKFSKKIVWEALWTVLRLGLK